MIEADDIVRVWKDDPEGFTRLGYDGLRAVGNAALEAICGETEVLGGNLWDSVIVLGLVNATVIKMLGDRGLSIEQALELVRQATAFAIPPELGGQAKVN